MNQRKVGDRFTLEGAGDFAAGIECEVVEIGEDGRITKAKAITPDERLLKVGFLQEGDNYIIVEWNITLN